jgi:hypothetical protein
MKTTISILTLFSTLLITHSLNAQDDDAPIAVTELSYLKSSTNIQVGIGLIDYDFQLGLGISGHLYISNLLEKLSGEISYTYAYLGKNEMQESEILPISYKDFRNQAYNVGLAYTIKQSRYAEDNELRLSGNSNSGGVYTIVEHSVIKSLAIRGGFNVKSFGFKYADANIKLPDSYIDVETNQPVYIETEYASAMLHQNINMVYAGFSIKKSYDSYFDVDKYGKRRSDTEKETYFDVLINVGSELLPIQKFVEHTFGGSIKADPISLENQTKIFSKFKKLPIGIRVGRHLTNRKTAHFSIDFYGGISPMYYLKIYQAIDFGVKINFRLFKALK